MNISTPLALLVTENKSIMNKGKDKDLTALPFEDFFKSSALCSLALAIRVRGLNRGKLLVKITCFPLLTTVIVMLEQAKKLATDEGLRLAFDPTFDKR